MPLPGIAASRYLFLQTMIWDRATVPRSQEVGTLPSLPRLPNVCWTAERLIGANATTSIEPGMEIAEPTSRAKFDQRFKPFILASVSSKRFSASANR